MASSSYERILGNADRNIDLELYYCGTQECAPGHSFGPGIKDHFKLHFVHSGRGTYTAGGATYAIGPGQIFLIYPDTLVRYEADRIDPWKYSWAAFDGLNARMYMTRAGFDESRMVLRCVDPGSVERDLLALVAASREDRSGENRGRKVSEIRLVGFLYLFMSALIAESADADRDDKNERNVKNGKNGRMNDHVAKAIRFIEKNYSHDVSVEDIAGYVCLERKYFSSLFKAQTGQSPKEFLTGLRFKRASSLLAHTRMTIGEISTSVGYDDPLLFSKSFRLHTGMSPSEYRSDPRAPIKAPESR